MDLELFHQPGRPNRFHKAIDRRIIRTGRICYYYEMTGWYDVNLAMRLLGHYRLFKLHINNHAVRYSRLSPEDVYILHYRENNILNNTWVYFISFLHFALYIKHPEINSINRTLVFNRPDILRNFLITAETDFEKALHEAIEQIKHPTFLSEAPITNVHVEITENYQHNTSLSKNELHLHPVVEKEVPPQKPAKGKEEGVFSKKQTLILLDLLAAGKIIEPIDFKKTNKFPAIAQLLRALTGHAEESWRDELSDYHTKGLYDWDRNFDGQRMELIRILVNLADKFRNAGFKTVAKLADQKIRELERAAP
ncbi:MAG TPA: hypothetical protein VGS79_07655 [Puia sp.]|nr:hypothetical protein [Puia sp.]